MPTSIYDSRAFVKRLTEAGMSEGQADALANENLLLIAEHLATKDDFRTLQASINGIRAEMVTKDEMRAEMATVRAEMSNLRADVEIMRADIGILRADMGALGNRLMVKLGGLMLVLATVVTAILGTLIALN